MFTNKITKSVKTFASVVGFVAAAALTGCGAPPVKPQVAAYAPDASWAMRVASHTNLMRNGEVIRDVDSVEELVGDARGLGSGIGSLALAAGALSTPTAIPGNIGVLDVVVALGMAGSAASTPDAPHFTPNVLAWFPVDQAKSPADARDKLHAMRVKSVKKFLDEKGVEYDQTDKTVRAKVLYGDEGQITIFNLAAEGAGNVLSACPDCSIHIATKLPSEKPVMAPKELTGTSFLAYQFDAYQSYHPSLTVFQLVRPLERKTYSATPSRAAVRNFEFLSQMNEISSPEWSVLYVPFFKPEVLKRFNDGGYFPENPYGFMVHKGEIKHFIKGH